MIIANEREYIEDILTACEKPMQLSVKGLIRYLAKYYYDDCCEMNAKEYARFVLDAVKIFNLPPLEYQEYKFARYTRDYCCNLLSGLFPHELREVNSISFTTAEIDRVNEAVYRQERKVLFALYAIAKIYASDTGWVNVSEIEIFKQANVAASSSEKLEILRALYRNDLIAINRTMDKSGYHVELFPDSPVFYTTNVLKDFGNQYVMLYNENVCMCEKCGKLMKIRTRGTNVCGKCMNESL